MPGDVHRVMDIYAVIQAVLHKTNIDVRRIEQCSAERSPVIELGEISIRQFVSDLSRHREAVGVDTRALNKNNCVSVLDVGCDKPLLWLHDANGRAREYCGVRRKNIFERRRLAAPPRTARQVAGILPSSYEIAVPSGIFEPH